MDLSGKRPEISDMWVDWPSVDHTNLSTKKARHGGWNTQPMSEALDRWSWTDAVERISWFLIRLSRARSANKAFRSIPDRCWSWQWPLRDVFSFHTCVTRWVHCFSCRLACQKPVNNYKLDIQSCLWILSVFYQFSCLFLKPRWSLCVFQLKTQFKVPRIATIGAREEATRSTDNKPVN